MKRLIAVVISTLLTSCATTKLQPLREMHYVADGWIVAAYDKKSRVHVQAKQLAPIDYAPNAKYSDAPYYQKQLVIQPGDTLQSIAYDEYGDIYLWDIIAQANEIPFPYSINPWEVLEIPQPDERKLISQTVKLDQWEVRLVNSGSKPVCANIEFMDIDYYVDIQRGWYMIEPSTTKYLGVLTQQPWELAESLFAFDDAKWVVNTLTIAPTKDSACVI